MYLGRFGRWSSSTRPGCVRRRHSSKWSWRLTRWPAREAATSRTTMGPARRRASSSLVRARTGVGYVLEDATVRGTPAQWAAAVDVYRRHQADRVVGEVNNGGDMVGYTLATIDPRVPFGGVWASRGKYTRA